MAVNLSFSFSPYETDVLKLHDLVCFRRRLGFTERRSPTPLSPNEFMLHLIGLTVNNSILDS